MCDPKNIGDVNAYQEDIEELPSVCTDSISFITARTAISNAFCRAGCYKKPPEPPICKEWSMEERSNTNFDVACSRFKRSYSKIEIHDQKNIGLRSVSSDEINQECFMLSSRVPRPCFCWKKSFFGCAYCDSRFCWTWPGWRSQPYYGKDLSTIKSGNNSFYPICDFETHSSITDSLPNQRNVLDTSNINKKEDDKKGSSFTKLYSVFSPSRLFMKNKRKKSKRLVMEEAERKEENVRWRERGGDRGSQEVATLPVKTPWLHGRVTTRVTLEGARHLSSSEGPSLNGILSGRRGEGEQRHRGEQTDPDDKPPKLVVNLNHSDKSSQIPEPLPSPEPEIESKKLDQVDGNQEQENSCLVDCLYVTLQCCDCSIM